MHGFRADLALRRRGIQHPKQQLRHTMLLVSQAGCRHDGHRSLQQGMQRPQTLVQLRSEEAKSRLRLSCWEPAAGRSLCDEASGAHGCFWCPTGTGWELSPQRLRRVAQSLTWPYAESPVMAREGVIGYRCVRSSLKQFHWSLRLWVEFLDESDLVGFGSSGAT